MGYDFFAYHRAKDDEYIFTTECMYAYEPVFKECIGEDGIHYFHGRVTKQKVEEFGEFLKRFKSNVNYNLDNKQCKGYLSNISYDKLIKDFTHVHELMKSGKCKYFRVG